MPRSSRSSRPTARAAPASAPSGTRSASTSATAPHPSAQHQQQHAAPGAGAYGAQTQQRQPGMLASMASTMGGVAAGSVVGHGISNMLFGGGSRSEAAPPPADLPAPVDSRMNNEWAGQQQGQGPSCGIEAKDFTKCLDATNDVQSCSYYLEALKACQSAAARY